jgi:hypothetical protein
LGEDPCGNFGSETEEEALRRSRAEHRFCGVSRKIFFSDFKNTVVKGTLTILGGKNN